MSEPYVKNVVEAALLAAGRPLAVDELVGVFDERDGVDAAAVQAALDTLREDYAPRGIELSEVASGIRVQIKTSLAEPVSKLWVERPAKYSRALLETLALVAYRQPITRGEIEQIRGVAVNPNIVKTLLERNWIRVVGHRDVPGRPELLGTTRDFLDYFGLRKLDDLPTLAQLKELEDLRVQLSLPGAEPIAAEAPANQPAAAEEGVDPHALSDEDADDAGAGTADAGADAADAGADAADAGTEAADAAQPPIAHGGETAE